MSLQKLRKGIETLCEILPNEREPLARLIINTDGFDMIVAEKGKYFSAITRQQYLQFDTEEIGSEIIEGKKRSREFMETEREDYENKKGVHTATKK